MPNPETMTPKQYLGQIRRLRILIDQRERELDSLQAARFAGRGTDYGGTSGGGPHRGGAFFEWAVIASVDMENETAALIERYNELRHTIIGQIQQLDRPEHMQVLYERYVEEKRWELIADEMGYSADYIRHLHGFALLDFAKIIKFNTQ